MNTNIPPHPAITIGRDYVPPPGHLLGNDGYVPAPAFTKCDHCGKALPLGEDDADYGGKDEWGEPDELCVECFAVVIPERLGITIPAGWRMRDWEAGKDQKMKKVVLRRIIRLPSDNDVMVFGEDFARVFEDAATLAAQDNRGKELREATAAGVILSGKAVGA